MGTRLEFALGLSALHSLCFFGLWGVYSLGFRYGVFARRQVAGGRAPADGLVRAAWREAIPGHVAFALVLYAVVFPLWQGAGGWFGAPLPSVFELAWQVVAFIAINDTLFYWSHRALHRPSFYRRIHVRHHRFRYVRGPSAEYAHVLENLANLVAFFAGPCLIGGHFATLCVWVVIRIFETVDAHSGYALTASASRHAFHHLYAAKGCYGSFFGLWDRLMGTDGAWRDWRAETARS